VKHPNKALPIGAIVVFIFSIAAAAATSYTNAMFRCAMSKDNPAVTASGISKHLPTNRDIVVVRLSSTPLYVLIAVKDPTAGTQRDVCVLSSSLEAAIAVEHKLDRSDDARKIFDIAMAAPNRTFTFNNPKARELVSPVYTPKQLTDVRKLLEGLSQRELRREAKVDLSKGPGEQSSVTKIYRQMQGKRFWSSDSYKVAVAHFLLEHGILVGELHDTGVLYVESQDCG